MQIMNEHQIVKQPHNSRETQITNQPQILKEIQNFQRILNNERDRNFKRR